ncbi:hypothetical protein [Chelativorans sp. Marseille-P2723]|uniref:hypothetical protein n=1 Tax=Chelativorans sp. Marseille-P2723 TaxID=2709133 RepID=UPI0015701EE7|nr:hypothetical protein [Chelativorans sp. Marseille-P2723]
MARKKSVQKTKSEGSGRRVIRTAHIHWIWVALATGLLFGGTSGYFVGQATSNGNGMIVDRYGRTPGNPHYGHNHP